MGDEESKVKIRNTSIENRRSDCAESSFAGTIKLTGDRVMKQNQRNRVLCVIKRERKSVKHYQTYLEAPEVSVKKRLLVQKYTEQLPRTKNGMEY